MSGGFYLRLFGTPELHSGGEVVRLPTRKSMALLAYLAVTRRRHGRESLAALLWPDGGQTRARASLRSALHAIRTALGKEVLLASRTHVEINRKLDSFVDVVQFQELTERGLDSRTKAGTSEREANVKQVEKAVEMYNADFLSGFNLSDCTEFEE